MKTKSWGMFVRRSASFRLLVITLAATGRLLGASVNLNPTADGFVTTGPANSLVASNYGGAGALALSAAGSAKGEFQSVLRFDTSSAKSTFDTIYGAGSWSLQSVTFQLTAASPNNAIFNANAGGMFAVRWMQNDSWVEGTGNPNAPTANGITFNTLQGTFLTPLADEALGAFNYDGSSSGTFTYTLNLPAGFSSDLLAGNNVGLHLLAADNAVSYFSDSRSFGTVASRPLLTIAAVPEPATVALLILGGLLCATRHTWTNFMNARKPGP